MLRPQCQPRQEKDSPQRRGGRREGATRNTRLTTDNGLPPFAFRRLPSHNPPMPEPLSYRQPDLPPVTQSNLPRVWPAVVLCLPGLVCWLLLGVMVIGIFRVPVLAPMADRFADMLDLIPAVPCLLMPFVPLAVLTAIASIETYWHRPKPWYIRLNLIVNISGLIFVGVVFVAGCLGILLSQ